MANKQGKMFNLFSKLMTQKWYLITRYNILYLLVYLKLINLTISIGKGIEKMSVLIPAGWSVNLDNYFGNQFGGYLINGKRAYPMTEHLFPRKYQKSPNWVCITLGYMSFS